MARHTLAPVPEGYSILPFEGRFYPLAVNIRSSRKVHMHTFVRREATVSFAKRSLAAQFLQKYAAGEATEAKIDFSTVESWATHS